MLAGVLKATKHKQANIAVAKQPRKQVTLFIFADSCIVKLQQERFKQGKIAELPQISNKGALRFGLRSPPKAPANLSVALHNWRIHGRQSRAIKAIAP
jgi:hypothetical protein